MLTAKYSPINCKRPAPGLEAGKEYKVKLVSMGACYTSIFLEGFDKSFNSIEFDFYKDGVRHNIYRDPEYNPYMRRGVQKSHDNKMDKAITFMKAQQEAEEAGNNEFTCPICGGTAWWSRSSYNNHLHAGCHGCDMKMME